jgi:hypothetical protein
MNFAIVILDLRDAVLLAFLDDGLDGRLSLCYPCGGGFIGR